MSPHTEAQAELQLWVERLERMAERLRSGPCVAADEWEDHRTEALGELWDTLNRVAPGLGDRALDALYPHLALLREKARQ